MKNLYLVLLIVIGTISGINGQTSRTETLSPSNSQTIQKTLNFTGDSYLQLGQNQTSYIVPAFGSTTTVSANCRFLFDHPSYQNSSIKQVTLSVTYSKQILSTGGNAIAQIKVPKSCNNSIPWGSSFSAKDLYSCNAGGDIIFTQGIGTGSYSPVTENFVLDHSFFTASGTNFTIALTGFVGRLSIGAVKTTVTYNCNPPSAPTGLSANAISSSQINLNWSPVVGATSYQIFKCNGTAPIVTTSNNTTSYAVKTGLQPGTNYGYRIKAVNSCASSVNYSTCANAKTPLNIPTNLSASATSNSTIQLKWNSVARATSYQIYNCAGVLIESIKGTSYEIPALAGGTNYSYKVRAVNASGSSSFTPCKGALTFPDVPTGLMATATSSSSISLSWNTVKGASSYDIYNCTGTLIANSRSNNFTHTGRSSQTFYQYSVRAKNASGSSNYSSCANTTTLIPSPSNLTAVANSNTDILLTWNNVTDATGYQVYSCSGVLVASLTGTSHIVSGLSSGTYYSYKVRTNTNTSNSAFSVCKIALTFPDVPTGLMATATSSSSISLSWNTVKEASSYDIYNCSGTLITNVTSNRYSVTGLSPQTNYDYKVIAKNVSGDSPFSACTNATTTILEPSNLTVTATSISTIQLAWNSVLGASGYEVYSCSGSLIKNVTGTTHNISGLSSGTSYSYKIRAIINTRSSGFTACADATTFIEPPTGLVVKPTANNPELLLSWNSVIGATGYKVYSCSGALVASVNLPFSSTIISGLSYNTYYEYKIEALSGNGNSTFSSCASGITILPPITNFKATGTGSNIKLSWNAVTGINYYEIVDCNTYRVVGTSTSSNYTVTGLAGGTTIGLKVRGVGASNSTAFSTCIYRTIPLSPVKIIYLTEFRNYLGVYGFQLRWWNDLNATHYEIYHCDGTLIGRTTSNLFTYYPPKPFSPGDGVSFKIKSIKNTLPKNESSYTECVLAFITPSCSPSFNFSGKFFWKWGSGTKYCKIYKASGLITSDNSVILQNSRVVMESETKVLLKTGFKATTGSFFNASIVDCSISKFRTDSEQEEVNEDLDETEASTSLIKVYPNPNKGQFNIELNNDEENDAQVEVYDVVGKQVFSKNNASGNLKIDLRDQTKGIYFVRVTIGEQVFNEKVIYQ